VRFGLYACGWDLMSGPLGGLVTLVTRGARDAIDILELTVKAPGLASKAFLQGVYQLSGDRLARARRTGTIATVLLVLVSAIAVAAALVLRMVL
jgi:hypothetical protein